ncbi:FAD-binding oxidoreductase [Streptomyces sp. NPDC051211]|uniref:FAD-binding oxidoreductase n=1 Tax=Streptomyces sp. NPDC051211 TaxID=3154643 RepID=UPI00344C0070
MDMDRRQVLGGALAGWLWPGSRREVDYRALGAALDGRLVAAGDAAYGEARQLYQPRYDRVAPGAVAYPAHDGDVAVCLEFARRSGVPVVARGGGHGYAGWSSCPGLVVDVGAMAQVSAGTGEVRVGAGARLGEVHAVLAARGVAVPAGLCPSVGIAGLTLGGGLGVSSRAYGAASDRLTGVRIVTADGIAREVHAGQEPELFWALRGGGGGNFGVVTEFRFRTHAVAACGFAELGWEARNSSAVLAGWQQWLGGLPDPLWSQVEFVLDGPGVPGPAVRVVCLDGRRELERELARLVGLVGSQPRGHHVVERGYADTMRTMGGCPDLSPAECRLPGELPGRDPRGRLGREDYTARSDFWAAGGLSAPAVEEVLAALGRYAAEVPAGGRAVVQFDGVCGGALNRVRAADTAFVHRDSAFLAQYLVYWPPGAAREEVLRHEGWLDRLWQRLRPWASGRAYQNYADPKLAGWAGAYYGPNLPRLEQVKRVYDPGRLFSFPQAVPSAGAGRRGAGRPG